MKTVFITSLLILVYLNLVVAYSKYGRSCKDIQCLSNEECTYAEDPCSFYQRQNECGRYPTCMKVNHGAASCATYVCPPNHMCQMQGSNPRCVPTGSGGLERYDTSSVNKPVNNNPYPDLNNPQDVPTSNRRTTTGRPNVRIQTPPSGHGYHGGQVGSGYPGQTAGRPAYPGGYPQQSGGYPQSGGGYPQQGSVYPGYGQQQPGGGYPTGNVYQNYPYNNNPNQRYDQSGSRYGANSGASSSVIDKISQAGKDALKSYGYGILRNALAKIATQ